MFFSFPLVKRTVVITGTTSGLGFLLLKKLLEKGHFVISISRNTQTLKPFKEAFKETLVLLRADFSNAENVESIKKTLEKYPVDVLVNNAGYGEVGDFFGMSLEKYRRQFEVNFFSAVELAKIFVALFLDLKNNVSKKKLNRKAIILNVGSSAGFVSTPFNGVYAASKHALKAINDAMRIELKPLGIRVVLFELGELATGYQKKVAKLLGKQLENKKNIYDFSLRRFKKNLESSSFLNEKKKAKAQQHLNRVVQKMMRVVEGRSCMACVKMDLYTHFIYGLRFFLPTFIYDFILFKKYLKKQ